VDPVTAIIASVAGIEPASLAPTARLSSDLDLDSLRRVELLGVIEEELGIFVNDDALEPDATVADLVTLVEAARGAKRGHGSWSWPLSPAVRALGLAFQVLLMYPFVGLFYRVRTTGLERLAHVEGPVLFTPNHCLHLDNAIICPPAAGRALEAVGGRRHGHDLTNKVQGVSRRSSPASRSNARAASRPGDAGQRLDRRFNVMLYRRGG
jgi:acyl carrier protein